LLVQPFALAPEGGVHASHSTQGELLGLIWLIRRSADRTSARSVALNLKHPAVVRKLGTIGKLKAGEAFSAEPVVKLANQWKPENLRAVVFVEDVASRKVLGAAQVAIGR
jgi:hypothetical protein